MNRRWLLWAALLLAGQAATLALINAGNLIGYQHYIDIRALAGSAPRWALLVFAVEFLVVAAGAALHRQAIVGALRRVGIGAVLFLAGVLVFTSATLSRDTLQFVGELGFASLVQLVHLGAVVLFALSLSPGLVERVARFANRVLGEPGAMPEPGGADRFAWALAGGTTLVAAVLALVAYQRHPHIPDEVAYLLQATYFAAGKLALPLPAVPEAFNVDLMTYQATRWYSCMPPGWPAILAIGVYLGIPWLLNPLFGGLNVLLAYVVLREFYPRRTARLALVLLTASPWALFMAMNLMNHTATLTATLLAALAVGRMRRNGPLRWAVVAGVGIGIVGLIRPLDGVAVAMLLGLWSLAARGKSFRFTPSAVMTITALLTGALTLPYNRALTGSASTFPVMTYFDAQYGVGSNALGFGANRGLNWRGLDPLMGHGPVDVAINSNFNLFQTNTELLGWATGSLLVIAMLFALRRARSADWLMLGAVAVVVAVQSLYWFSGGPDFGARYWFLILLPCLALAARGIESVASGAEGYQEGGGARTLAAAGLLVVGALVVFVPWRAADKYFHYRGMRPDIRALAADPELQDGMILIRGKRHPDYASAVVYGAQDLESRDPVIVWERADSTRAALAHAYPARRFWVVDGPSITGNSYRVIAGPLTAADLLLRRDPPVPQPERLAPKAP